MPTSHGTADVNKASRFDGMGRIDGRAERPYVMVDRELIELLDPDELALYVVLLSYLRSPDRMTDRECWPSEQEISRVYGRSHDVVRRVMKKLIDRGLVTKTRRGKTESNRYRLAATMPGSDDADPRHHSRGDYADPRTRDDAKTRSHDDADPRNEVQEPEVEEGKDKNHPGSSTASLSPSVPRAPAQDEREVIMTKLAKQHGASIEEIEGAWQMASNPDFPGADEYRTHFRDWFGAWIKKPDEVAQDLANHRDKLRYDARQAEFAARGNCAFHWQPQPCRGCAADAKAVSDEP